VGTGDDGFQSQCDDENGMNPSFGCNTNVGDIDDLDQLKNYYQALKDMHLNRLAANAWAGPAYLRLQRALGGGGGMFSVGFAP
jgi:hypothetical protein